MVVRPFVTEHRDDRLMIVFPARDVDPGGFARAPSCGRRRRSAAARAARGHPRARRRRRARSRVDAASRATSTAARCSCPRRPARAARRAECRFSCIKPSGSSSSGSKWRLPGFEPSATAIRRIGQPGSAQMRRRPRSSAACASSSTKRRWSGRRTRLSARGAGIGGIDDDRGQAARIERGGERQADQAAAEDDHVRAVHGASVRPFRHARSECDEAIQPQLLDCFAALATTSLTAESAWGILGAGYYRGWDMATVATRAPKRELAPDWRDALRDAVRRFVVRSGRRAADRRQPGRRARAGDAQPERSLAQHRRRRSAGQLAGQRRRLFQRRAAAAVRARAPSCSCR